MANEHLKGAFERLVIALIGAAIVLAVATYKHFSHPEAVVPTAVEAGKNR
jgi:hypothetical protein